MRVKTQNEYSAEMTVIGFKVRSLVSKRGDRSAADLAQIEQLREEMLGLCAAAKADGYDAETLNWRAMLAVRAPKVAP